LSSKDGRGFIFGLESNDATWCIEILDQVRSNTVSTVYDACSLVQIQAFAGRHLQPSEKQVFFASLRKLAGAHGRLPNSMVITDEVEIPDSGQPYASGGFADIKQGKHQGHTVAVKMLRVSASDDVDKIRKVRRMCSCSRDQLTPSSSTSVRRLLSGTRYPTPMS
jgi:hypothetical protein